MTKTDQKSSFNKSVTGSKFPSVANSPKNVKSPKSPRVTAPKVSSTTNGFHFDTMVQGAVNVQLMPLTKADNITIKLASPSDSKNAAFKQENKNKEKINKMELISNNQSFQCVVYCSITETEVNLKVYLNSSSSGAGSPNDKPRIENFIQSKPILSLYSDLLMPYNILATPNDALNQLHIQQQHIHSGNTTNILFFCGDPYVRAEWAQFINSPHHNQQTQQHNSSNFNDHISRTPVLFKTQNSLGITTAQLSPVIGTRKPLISFDSPQQQQQFSSAQQSGQSTANNQNNSNQSNNNNQGQSSNNQNYNPSPRSHTIHSPTPPAGTPRSFDSPVRNRSISLGADSYNRPPIVLPISTTKSDPNAANVFYSQGVSSSGSSGDNYGEISNNSGGAGVNRHDLLKASLLKANHTNNDYNTVNNSTEIAVTKAIHSLSVDSGAQLPYGSIKISAPFQSHHTQQSHSGLSQLTEANLLMLGSTSKATSENNMNIGVSGGISGDVSVAGSTVANSTILGSNNVQNSYNYNNTPSVTNTSVHSSAYRTQAAGSFVLPGNGYSQLTVNLSPQQALSSGTATPTTYQVNNYINSPAQSPRYNNTVAADSNGDNREHSSSGEMNSSQQQQQQQAPLSRIEQLREEIEKIKQEINVTELTYQREELQLCANEEASLKDSVNTVYSSLLQQGLLPTELSAEQEKVKVWEKVQRAKNEKKSTQRLQIIETEMQSMRAEGNDLITKLLQEIKTEEERIKTEKAATAQQDLQNQPNSHNSTHSNNNSTQNSPTNRLQRMTERTITDTKARFQAQIDQIRQEMIEKEASLKRETEEKNKEEETKLQDTITAVFDSLLASTELSPTELLSEQDKVHVWENIQRAKLAKSLKQRRKNMNKEINKMLSEGREEVKRLMILQRDTSLLQNQQLLEQMNDPNYAFLETVANSNNVIVYEVDDEVVKSRTYSDLNSVQTLGDKGQVFQIPADSIQNQLSPAVSPVVTTHKVMYGADAGIAAGSNSSSVAGGIAFTDSRSRTSSDAVSTSGLGRSRASSDHDNEVTKQMREANRQAQLREILTQQELHEQKVEQDRVNRLTQQQREDEARLAAVAIQMKEQQRAQEELKAEQAAQLIALQKAENDQLIARLKQNIDSLQEQTLLAEKSLLEEEARLCIEESASLTSSVSAVYNSLLTQNLSPEKLLKEQEKVQVWEHIQRRKQQKQTNKRKAQLKTKIVLVKQNATDKIAALTTELNNAINQHYGGSNMVAIDGSVAQQQQQQQFTPEPIYTSVDNSYNTYSNNSYNNNNGYDNSFINYDSNSNDVGEETEAERKIKDYSRQQFELHSTAQRELFDKQQALLTEIANKKAQMIIEENQRLEAIRLEKEAAIRREIDRVEALRLEAEALRIAEEERLQKIADDERIAAELLEQEKQAEIVRIWTEQKEDFEARIRLKLVLKIQRKFRFYQERKILHKATTALQKVVRGYLIKNRIQKHFRHAIVLIENQSACIITNTLRQYIKHIKMKFRGWELIQELVVASVLEHCLQKREILLLRNKKKAIQKKKDKLRDQMNERENIKARKRQEKEALREAQEEEKRAQERERLAALRKEKEKEELKRAQEQEKIEAAKEKQRLLEFEKSIKRKKKT